MPHRQVRMVGSASIHICDRLTNATHSDKVPFRQTWAVPAPMGAPLEGVGGLRGVSEAEDRRLSEGDQRLSFSERPVGL